MVDLETTELDNPGNYLNNLTQEAEILNSGGTPIGGEALEKITQNIDKVGKETSKVINEIKRIANPEQ